MPTHVYANNNEVASKAADGKSIAAFPDVCFSPPAPPVGPMPLPYPNTGEVKDTDSGTTKVFIKDKMSAMAGDSYMTKSMGDEPATKNFNKGLITGALQGKCYFGLWSMDVQMEGKGVPRHLDMVTHNHDGKIGNTPPMPNISCACPPASSSIIDKLLNELTFVSFKLIDGAENPVPFEKFTVTDPTGKIFSGALDENGEVRIENVKRGRCKILFEERNESIEVFYGN